MTYVGKSPADIIATAVDTTTGTFSGDLTVDTNTLYVDSANNRVGVGTVSPAFKSQVESPVALSGSGNDYYFAVGNSSNNSRRSVALGVDGVFGNAVIAGYNNFNPGLGSLLIDGTDIQARTNGTERMRIDSSGNVGIGLTPNAKLEIDGEIRISDQSADSHLYLRGASGQKAKITLNEFGVSSWEIGAGTKQSNNFTIDYNGNERMRIDSSGRVGIGGTPVGYPLEIYGGNGDGLLFKETTNSVTNWFGALNSVGTVGTTTNHPLAFYTNGTQNMRIDSNGDVQFLNSGGNVRLYWDKSAQGLISAGAGISFDAGANYLDDYEEGTWTPTYSFIGGGTVTTTGNVGKYVKIGSLVQASFKIRSTGVSGVSGYLQINGLPFSISSEERSGGSVSFMRNWGSDMPNFRLYPVQNTQIIYMYYNATNTSASQVGTGEFSTGSDNNVLEAHVIYQV